jgi:purine-binding chemotaxis protein CheW
MPPVAIQTDRTSRILHFTLAGEHLAVDIRWLRGVVVVEEYAVVPSAPPHLLGLANLRGLAVPLLDAGPALGRPGRRRGGRTLVLVVAAGETRVGLAIDAVLGLDDAGLVVPFGEGTPRPHLELGFGLVRRGDVLTLLLNTPKLLNALRINARWAL